MRIEPGVGLMRQGQVAVPIEAVLEAPHITWKHVDGPMMSWAGHIHWLTMMERIRLWTGCATPEQIANERFNRDWVIAHVRARKDAAS